MNDSDKKDLYKKFVTGLKDIYDLPFNDIKHWEYAGNNGSGIKYYHLKFPNSKKLPEYTDTCICGHFIINNSYITDGKRILVLGSCCVKRFIPNGTKRLCSECHLPHKNTSINKCNACRVGYCDRCNTTIDPDYKMCYKCKYLKKNNYQDK